MPQAIDDPFADPPAPPPPVIEPPPAPQPAVTVYKEPRPPGAVGRRKVKATGLDFEAIMLEIEGGTSLRAICARLDPDAIPRMQGILSRMIASTAENTRRYEVATINRALLWADEIVAMSEEDCTEPVYDSKGKEIGRATDHARVQQLRLRIDTKKWVAAHLLPKYANQEEKREMGDALTTLLRGLAGRGKTTNSALPIAQRVDDVEG